MRGCLEFHVGAHFVMNVGMDVVPSEVLHTERLWACLPFSQECWPRTAGCADSDPGARHEVLYDLNDVFFGPMILV